MERKLRKYQDILRISGTGVIAFGVWSIARTILSILLGDSLIETIVTEMAVSPEEQKLATVVAWVLLILFMILDIGLRLYIGLRARAEGAGKKKGIFYIIWAFLLALAALLSMVEPFLGAVYNAVQGIQEEIQPMSTGVTSFIVDLTSFIALINMIVSAVRVKTLRKQIERAGDRAAD